MSALQITWFFILSFLIVGYALLDGYDLGVGCWYPFARTQEHRRALISAIAPFWDGNEVWLITAGGVSFAAFPPVYATVFSSFYFALMLVLVALILRDVSIEFGSREQSPTAQALWGVGFATGSILTALLLGVAFGNLLRGLPLNANGDYTGTFLTLLNPFALLIGVLNLAMLAMYGALFLRLKTEGELEAQVKGWAQTGMLLLFPLALATIIAAAITQPHLLRNYLAYPVLWVLPALALLAIMLAGVWNMQDKPRLALLAGSATIVLLLGAAVMALFPTLVPALGHPEWNLTVANSSSSPYALTVMLIITSIGMPLVLLYTIFIHRIFGGKVKEALHY